MNSVCSFKMLESRRKRAKTKKKGKMEEKERAKGNINRKVCLDSWLVCSLSAKITRKQDGGSGWCSGRSPRLRGRPLLKTELVAMCDVRKEWRRLRQGGFQPPPPVGNLFAGRRRLRTPRWWFRRSPAAAFYGLRNTLLVSEV